MIGSLLASAVALSFLSLAAGAAISPRALAENYGLPASTETELAYVRALGARDAVLGLLVAWFLATRKRDALGTTIAFSALVGASDFATVLTSQVSPTRGMGLAIHGSGTLGLLLVWQLVRTGR